MGFRLLTLPENGLSLEFTPADVKALRLAIDQQFGEVQIKRHTLFDQISFAGEEFTLYHEWDPCLLSSTPQGNTLLRQLFETLSRNEAA